MNPQRHCSLTFAQAEEMEEPEPGEDWVNLTDGTYEIPLDIYYGTGSGQSTINRPFFEDQAKVEVSEGKMTVSPWDEGEWRKVGYRPEIWDRRRTQRGRQRKRQKKTNRIMSCHGSSHGLYRGVNWLMADQNRCFL